MLAQKSHTQLLSVFDRADVKSGDEPSYDVAYDMCYRKDDPKTALSILRGILNKTDVDHYLISICHARRGDALSAINAFRAAKHVDALNSVTARAGCDYDICDKTDVSRLEKLAFRFTAELFTLESSGRFTSDVRTGEILPPFLYLAAEVHWHKTFRVVADSLGVKDDHADNTDLPDIAAFVPKSEHDESLQSKYRQYNMTRVYLGDCFDKFIHFFSPHISPTTHDSFIDLKQGEGAYALDMRRLPGLESMTPRLVFRHVHRYDPDYFGLADVYRGVLGLDRFAAPVGEVHFSDGQYVMMQQGAIDLDVMLSRKNIGTRDKFFAIADFLMTHALFQQRLKSFAKSDGDQFYVDSIPQSFFSQSQRFDFEPHDYDARFMQQVVLGSAKDKRPRLADASHYRSSDGARRYVHGDPHLDALLSTAHAYVNAELRPNRSLPQLVRLCDTDPKAANYLIDGKIVDADMVRQVNSLYTSARIKGTPSVHSFLQAIPVAEQEELVFDYLSTRNGGLVPATLRNDFESVCKHTAVVSDPLFGMHACRILRDVGAQPSHVDLRLIKRQHDSHIGWIDACHAFGYECKNDDAQSAQAYLTCALSALSQDETRSGFLRAYTGAIKAHGSPLFKEIVGSFVK